MEEICEVTESQFERLADVWEASVKVTHDFLTEQDVLSLRSKVLNDYLAAVTLRAYKDEQGSLQGFVGVSNGKVEMLFISPEYRGMGIGKLLLNYAINHLGATELDVNEQNPLAIAFYKHMGFKVIGRSLVDSLGNPFPLLHMRLGVSYK
ncbi:GNAT family N-acetyltransferase [Azotobacter salinestris]